MRRKTNHLPGFRAQSKSYFFPAVWFFIRTNLGHCIDTSGIFIISLHTSDNKVIKPVMLTEVDHAVNTKSSIVISCCDDVQSDEDNAETSKNEQYGVLAVAPASYVRLLSDYELRESLGDLCRSLGTTGYRTCETFDYDCVHCLSGPICEGH